jgi:CxxC motif-containing protein (DUF1111 family)
MSVIHTYFVRISCAVALMLSAGVLCAQTDPGPRSGPAAAGSFYPTLNSVEQGYFNHARTVFEEVDSVSGSIAGETGSGLGPTFNGNSCAMCHAQPAAGGSSPGMNSPQNPIPNPQVALATLHGAINTVPSFIIANGPVREARFISTNPLTSGAPLDGGVHGLYTIAGRSDATGCTLAQPDFATQTHNNNVIFRIPTPIFGLGLVENTPDSALQANLAANLSQKTSLGIGGHLNTSGNDGTVTRFGWKAQNKSLIIFAGEAYNVEQGVSNDAFPNERSAVTGCVFNSTPEDRTDLTTGEPADIVNFAMFMRLSAPPVPSTATSVAAGSALFNVIGCSLCHTPTLTSGASPYTGMSDVSYHPYSDFALHNMGSNLADGILQGNAGPAEFRTAPLWGLGQRLFFLHDGRTSDLMQAIQAHSSPTAGCVTTQNSIQFQANSASFQPLSQSLECGSEANQVIQSFNNLDKTKQQAVLIFLRSL